MRPLTMPPVAPSDVRLTTSVRAWVVLALAGVALLLAAAPAAAGTFPGKNGKIAYEYLDTIYTIDPEGGGGQRLVTHPDGGGEPSWSPRGDRLAFVSKRGGERDIYVIDADGTDERRLTSNDAIEEENPSWVDDDTVIFRADPESGAPTFSTADLGAAPTSTYALFRSATPEVVDNFIEPEISAGGELLFTEYFQVPGTSSFLSAAWTASGNGPATKFSGLLPQYSVYSGGWSPDGVEFLYLGRTPTCCSLDIFVASAAGSAVNITNTPGRSEATPRFSPDGTMVVYGDLFGGDKLYVSAADGSGEITLPTGFFAARNPDWQALGGATPPPDSVPEPAPAPDSNPGSSASPSPEADTSPPHLRGRPIVRNGSTTLVVVVPSAGRLTVQQANGGGKQSSASLAAASADVSAVKGKKGRRKGKKGKGKKGKRRPHSLIRKVVKRPKRAGPVRVKIEPTRLGRKALKKRGRLTVKVRGTFVAAGAKRSVSFARKVTVKKKGKRGKGAGRDKSKQR